MGLARGGVVVAAEVASILLLPLSVLAPRKLGAPGNRELAIGAVMETGECYLNEALIQELGVTKEYLAREIHREQALAQERQALFTPKRPTLKNKTVILVDDGVATGATMLASILFLRKQHPSKIVVAAPICSPSVLQLLKHVADEIWCLSTDDFGSVSMVYESFPEIPDRDVLALLRRNDYI